MSTSINTKKLNILVTGAGGPAGVNILKLLSEYKNELNIFAIDINPYSAGQFFADEFAICERVVEKQKYLDWTIKYINEKKIDLILPTVAEELVLMQEIKSLLPENVKIIASSSEVLALCDIKTDLYKWMDTNFPDYMGKWEMLEKGKNISLEFENYFIKPIKGRGSRGCRAVSKSELEYIISNLNEEIVAMELLPGREWTTDAYINEDGSFAYIVPRLRLGLSGGISSIGKTDRNDKVIQMTREVLTSLKCRGPVFIQWKEDVNGKPKMVEINPRLSGGVTITALSGANPAKALVSEYILHTSIKDMDWNEVTVTRYFEEKIVK